MKQSITRIVYSIIDDRGFIVDKVATFNTHKEAIDYLQHLKTQSLHGKPVLEVK
jgi:hypothetical protein